MLVDLRDEPDAALVPSDVCIIGSGAAGISLCRRISKQGHSVILLESGGLDFEKETQDLYQGNNIGMPYYDLDQSRLRFFGGTVSIWGGRCALLDHIDFNRRAWVPHSGWPITRSDLDQFYREAHDWLQLGRFNYEHEIWEELGIPTPGFDPSRINNVLWRFDESTERFTAAQQADLIAAPNVRILLHANAVRIHVQNDASAVRHVEVRPIDGTSREVRARHFILACGAIENARLLLASNDVEANGIGNSHDQVGRYFMEHPSGRLGKISTPDPFGLWATYQKRFMKSGPPLAPAIRIGDKTQEEHQALNSIGTLKLQRDPSKGVALGNKLYHNLKHSISPNRSGRALDHAYRAVRGWIHREVRGPIERTRVRMGTRHLYLMTRGEQAPNPDSRILLSSETDALGVPRANLDWQLSAIDKHTAKVFAETFDAELRRLKLGSLKPADWLQEKSLNWPVDHTIGNHPIGNYHQVGGTRMSAEPTSGVVDGNCRVHGYANLFVAGGSVFPTSGWANPTLTIIALALRLGDHISQQLQRS
jgi:choline dehydrogenase-like flavoprotein